MQGMGERRGEEVFRDHLLGSIEFANSLNQDQMCSKYCRDQTTTSCVVACNPPTIPPPHTHIHAHTYTYTHAYVHADVSVPESGLILIAKPGLVRKNTSIIISKKTEKKLQKLSVRSGNTFTVSNVGYNL